MPKRKLFAVLCAINDYNSPVSKLNGCVNDAEEWSSLLSEQKDSFDVRLEQLYNDAASKREILTALAHALDTAAERDVVFFYYSGHGARESSHDVFKEIDSDGAFETLVCYDGITYDGEMFNFNLISDKELHYIISTHAKPGTHIVLVMDSCHSGNITRNAFDIEGESIKKRQFKPPGKLTSRLSTQAPRREWSDFIFGDTFSASDIEQGGWIDLVPQRPHIAMSACLNDESAFEVDGHGVFTTNLIKVLRRTQCEISYRSLQARVRQFVRNQLNQTPEIFSTRENAEDLLLNFLSKEGPPRAYRANCFYSDNKVWTIDLGSIHGVRLNSGPVIIETKREDISVELANVKSSISELSLSDAQLAMLDIENAYDASVVNYMNGGTSFYVEKMGDSGVGKSLSENLRQYLGTAEAPLGLTENRSEAQYLIGANGECLTIAKNSSEKYPVWRVIYDENASGRLMRAMNKITKWEYVRSYDNPEVNPDEKFPVELYLEVCYPNGEAKQVEVVHNRIVINYEEGVTMRIRLDNKSEDKYFCALLYLSNTFDIEGGLIDGKVKGVQAKTSEWALNGRSIPVTMEPHVVDFNMPASLSYIKLIANEQVFDVDAMEQSGLPAPRPKCSENTRSQSASRGLEIDKGVSKIAWFTHTIELKVVNPYFEENRARID